MSNVTIREVDRLKRQVEVAITQAIASFEAQTSLSIESVRLQHVHELGKQRPSVVNTVVEVKL